MAASEGSVIRLQLPPAKWRRRPDRGDEAAAERLWRGIAAGTREDGDEHGDLDGSAKLAHRGEGARGDGVVRTRRDSAGEGDVETLPLARSTRLPNMSRWATQQSPRVLGRRMVSGSTARAIRSLLNAGQPVRARADRCPCGFGCRQEFVNESNVTRVRAWSSTMVQLGRGGHDPRANRASNGSTRRCSAGGGEVITVSSRNRSANSAIQVAPRTPVGMLRAL